MHKNVALELITKKWEKLKQILERKGFIVLNERDIGLNSGYYLLKYKIIDDRPVIEIKNELSDILSNKNYEFFNIEEQDGYYLLMVDLYIDQLSSYPGKKIKSAILIREAMETIKREIIDEIGVNSVEYTFLNKPITGYDGSIYYNCAIDIIAHRVMQNIRRITEDIIENNGGINIKMERGTTEDGYNSYTFSFELRQ